MTGWHTIPTVGELRERISRVSQYKLSEKSGISRVVISKINNCHVEKIRYDTFVRLWNALDEMEAYDAPTAWTMALEICTRKLVSVRYNVTLDWANRLFDINPAITQLPVFDEKNCPAGLIDEGLLRKNMSAKNWQKIKVKEIMVQAPPVVDYNTTIREIEALLNKHPCVLVKNKSGRNIAGIITDWDLRKYYKQKAKSPQ